MKFPTYKFETKKLQEGYKLVAGCDEVGVAPLAGPVVAATVILDFTSIGKQRSKSKWWYRVRDSKTVSEKERNELYQFILEHSLDYAIGSVSNETIDEINILKASQLAMKKSVSNLKLKPDFLFLDGKYQLKNVDCRQEAVISGDVKVLSVAAASIVAKVTRDRILNKYHETFPAYGFKNHKGYPTRLHKLSLLKYGVCPVHRVSFDFVKQVIDRFCSSFVIPLSFRT